VLFNQPVNYIKMRITKENLINHFGMVETEGDEKLLFPMKKVISVKNHLDEEMEEDEGELAICVTMLRNKSELCLSMPDGSILYLTPRHIEDLNIFERCIESYEPVF